MNPVIRQILDNIGRLGRELKNNQPNPPQTNGGTMSNERTVSVEGEVSQIFRRSTAQPSPSICTSNASFTSTVSNVITISTSTAAQQGPSNSTISMLTPHFRLSYNFNNSRAGQNTRKKGKAKSDKELNGPFIKDVILLGGPDQENVPQQGAWLWLMENGHVLVAATFQKEWNGKALPNFLKVLFPSKLGAFDDVEIVMSVHSRLMAPILAPAQALSSFLLQKVFKDKPVYVRPMCEILPLGPSFKKAKHDSEVRTAEREREFTINFAMPAVQVNNLISVLGVIECTIVCNILYTPSYKLVWCDIVCTCTCRVGTLGSQAGYILI